MLGERLRLAREAAGLHQLDAAQALGIVVSGISDIENGNREPRAAQLAMLAGLYRRPLSFFFSEEPVMPDVVLWRARPAEESKAKRIQREFLSLCEDYQELEQLTNNVVPSGLPEESGAKDRFGFPQAESLAARIWQEFELGAAPAECLRPVLEERYRVKIFALALASEASAASTRNNRFGPATLLNQDNVHWRRNFSLAHELFHLLTWRVFRSPGEASSIEAGEDEEGLANAFAAHLLLPESPFRERLGPYIDNRGNLKMTLIELHGIARSFDVSAEAVVYRCAGLLHWRKEDTKAVIQKLGCFRMWRERQSVETLPSRYIYLTVQAYRQGLISFGRGAEYLRKSYRHARDILEPPEDEVESDGQIAVAFD